MARWMVVTFTLQHTGTGETTLQPKHLLHKSYQRRTRIQDEDFCDVGQLLVRLLYNLDDNDIPSVL